VDTLLAPPKAGPTPRNLVQLGRFEDAMPRLVQTQPRQNFRLFVRYDDGAEGEVDLSNLVGRGVFAAWNDPGVFESVTIGPQGQLMWGEAIELCGDSIYLRLTGKSPEEILPGLKQAGIDA